MAAAVETKPRNPRHFIIIEGAFALGTSIGQWKLEGGRTRVSIIFIDKNSVSRNKRGTAIVSPTLWCQNTVWSAFRPALHDRGLRGQVETQAACAAAGGELFEVTWRGDGGGAQVAPRVRVADVLGFVQKRERSRLVHYRTRVPDVESLTV